jgi:hypothetical protein
MVWGKMVVLGDEKKMKEANMTKVCYLHIWKYHKETSTLYY